MADHHQPGTEERRVRSLMAVGADLAGAIGGTGAGLVIGPFGGAALGVAITRAGNAVAGRLFDRERDRVGAALVLIAEDAQGRQQRGERLRDDGFFDDRGALRPEAVDLLEGVLRQAAGAYEERKVALLARLYTEVAHDAGIPTADGFFLVRLAGELTYRQFVALSALHRGIEAPIVATLPRRADAELDDLGERHLVGLNSPDGFVRTPGRMHNSMTYDSLKGVPETASAAVRSNLALTPTGQQLVQLTGAAELIADDERAAWANDPVTQDKH
jgi:hypothetical protein